MMSAKLVPVIVRHQFYSTALAKTVPVVTIPAYVKDHVERQKVKARVKQLQAPKVVPRGGNKAFPLISGQRADFDFYLGQHYPKNYRIPLITDHWGKKNTSGQKFTIHKHGENPSLPVVFNRIRIDEKFEFSQFGLQEEIVEAVKALDITHPTPPQSKVIPEIMKNKHVLFIAESGCGKTMGYGAPVIHSIMNLKKKVKCQPNSPLALVIVPGKELAEQIAQEAYRVGMPCGVDVRVLISDGTQHEHLVPKDNTNVDLLVGTFGTCNRLFGKKIFSMSNLHHVILDEADTLLDDSFSDKLLPFLQYLMARNDESYKNLFTPSVQLLVVSCIWPSEVESMLSDLIPVDEMVKIISPHSHQLMSHVTHKFERVRHSLRAGALLEHVKADQSRKMPIMVFANQSPACDWMSTFFEDNNVPNAKFHAGMSAWRRTAAFNDFKDGIVNVLCCTDLASRGLDVQWVRHIINFDFPHNMSDYIHRAGRIGRVGTNHGYITNFVHSVPGVVVAQQIEMAIRTSTGLPSINTNIKRKIEKLKLIEQYRS